MSGNYLDGPGAVALSDQTRAEVLATIRNASHWFVIAIVDDEPREHIAVAVDKGKCPHARHYIFSRYVLNMFHVALHALMEEAKLCGCDECVAARKPPPV